MLPSSQVTRRGLSRASVVAALVFAAVLPPREVRAQAPRDVVVPWRTAEQPTSAPFRDLRRSLAAVEYRPDMVPNWTPTPGVQASSSGRQRSTGRKVAGGMIGAVGGFFGGGFLGAAIEGDRCDCDDPGFVGFWIGAPVGSALGAFLGAKFF